MITCSTMCATISNNVSGVFLHCIQLQTLEKHSTMLQKDHTSLHLNKQAMCCLLSQKKEKNSLAIEQDRWPWGLKQLNLLWKPNHGSFLFSLEFWNWNCCFLYLCSLEKQLNVLPELILKCLCHCLMLKQYSVSALCASCYRCFTMIKSIIVCFYACVCLCVTRAKGNSLIPEIDSLWLPYLSKESLASDHCNPPITESHSPTKSRLQPLDLCIRRLQQVTGKL